MRHPKRPGLLEEHKGVTPADGLVLLLPLALLGGVRLGQGSAIVAARLDADQAPNLKKDQHSSREDKRRYYFIRKLNTIIPK